MDEWVAVLDDEGRDTGSRILKSEAHRKGIFHPTVHIWFFNKEGEVLLQQRAKDKKTFPLYWDVSVAGHIGAGEPLPLAAIREVQEEIGLSVSEQDLIPVGVFKSVQRHHADLIDSEFHHTFICRLNKPLSELALQKEEVKDIRLMPLDVWEKDLFTGKGKLTYVPHDKIYYKEVINAVRKHL